MSATRPPADAAPPAKPAAAAVIRRLEGAHEEPHERLMKKHLPAWVISGAVHVALIALAILILGGPTAETKPADKVLDTTAQKDPEDPVTDLTNDDEGLQSTLTAALPDIEREAERNVEGLVTQDPIGIPNTDLNDPNASAPPGFTPTDSPNAGAVSDTGALLRGDGGAAGLANAAFAGRSAATKDRLLRAGGGNQASELAVARGLAWLARQQKTNGSWVFDGESKNETVAATGMALLPFLAAGQTHKTGGKYQKTVDQGLKFLIANMNSSGKFSNGGMYAHGIATMALCEAYGMTKDKGLLLKPTQAAINFIVAAQAPNGSWGYQAPSPGDTSIVGWQVQALQAARLSKDIVVPDHTLKNATAFLDRVSSGSRKAVYGYATPNGKPGTSLTAVGLLCRYYIDGWGPGNAGLAEGVEGLMKRPPQKAPAKPDMYYFYYATQVVHFYEGTEWRDWNEGPKDKDGKRSGGMRDWLIALQDTKQATGPTYGSWEPDAGTIGSHCGRVGTTAMALLTLEVYYRHLPLYKRGQEGGKAGDVK